MNALIAVSVADGERELAAEQAALADARRAGAGAEADLSAARSRLAEDPSDENAEAVEVARRSATKFSELVQARETRVAEAERRLREARRVEDRAELAEVEREAGAHLAELPKLFSALVRIHRLAAEAADQIEDLAEKHSDAHERAAVLAKRLGVTNPVRSVPLAVVRVAAGLHLADAVGLPEIEAEELRTNLGLARAVRDLAAVRLDAADLVPAVDRLLAEIDAALGATAARWIEPLRDASWNTHEAERVRHEAAEALLAELEGDADG